MSDVPQTGDVGGPGQSTLLLITPTGLPVYSSRGIRQSYAPVNADLRRTINGVLKNVMPSQMLKYKSTITCDDMNVPALDGVFPGTSLTINCVFELAYLNGGTPQRTVVSGSSRTDGVFTYYRPQIVFLVRDYEVDVEEWGAKINWRLECEEV